MKQVNPPDTNIERMLSLSERLIRLQQLIVEKINMKKKSGDVSGAAPTTQEAKPRAKLKVGKRIPVETDMRAGVEWTDVWANVQKATEVIAEDVAEAAKAAPTSLGAATDGDI